METIIYELTITPAIPVKERHQLQDFIESLGYVITGGGQFVDGSECDITFQESPFDSVDIKGE